MLVFSETKIRYSSMCVIEVSLTSSIQSYFLKFYDIKGITIFCENSVRGNWQIKTELGHTGSPGGGGGGGCPLVRA